jgi:hypothetical protein
MLQPPLARSVPARERRTTGVELVADTATRHSQAGHAPLAGPAVVGAASQAGREIMLLAHAHQPVRFDPGRLACCGSWHPSP